MARWLIRGRWLWLAAAGVMGGLLAACASPLVVGPAGDGTAPEFEVSVDKAGDRAVVTSGEDRAIFDVWSETGIGGASVTLTAGEMPQSIFLRLHLHGLEQMTFAYDGTVVSLSVSSSGDRPALQSATVDGVEMPVTPTSPYWMDVTWVESEAGAGGGYYQVAAPPAFFEAAATEFRITWIDFYR